MLSVTEAKHLIIENTALTNHIISKNLIESKDYILAENIIADRDYPPYNRATMDGYALSLNDLIKQREFTVIGEIFAGDNWKYNEVIPLNSAVKIMTGAVVPENFDIVIKVEDTKTESNKVLILSDSFRQWMNIAMQGEDAKKGEILISPSIEIDDSILTVAASLGYTELKVFSPPRISLLSTGNEIMPQGKNPQSHQIRDSNTITLQGMLKEFNSGFIFVKNLPDDEKILLEKLKDTFDSDFCIITGGVSAGDADYIPSTLKSLGVQEIFHKVLIRPGKPIWFGKRNKTLYFGLPGNPVSARVTFKVFVEPAIRKFMNIEEKTKYYLPLLEPRTKKHKLTEYFRVKVVNLKNVTYIKEIFANGSGDFISSIGSDGIAIHPMDTLEIGENTNLEFLPW